MRILGVDLPHAVADGAEPEHSVVLLDPDGLVTHVESVTSLLSVAAAVTRLAGGEPFLLAVNAPVVIPGRAARARPVENLVRRRLGVKLPPGGRSALTTAPGGVAGEALLAALAAAGQPCLPFPDRGRRQSSLAEIRPQLVVKALLWERSALAAVQQQSSREELFRAYSAPPYRAGELGPRVSWTRHAVAVDLLLGALRGVAGYDIAPARDALALATSEQGVERAAAVLDASLLAGTARRYLDSPESCLFLGDHENGYVILPADEFVRRLGSAGSGKRRGRLFPERSLRDRLGDHAQLRSVGLFPIPGRPTRTEADFTQAPRYEFDNLDELLWWKHCRHVSGPTLPTEGLVELLVEIDSGSGAAHGTPLTLTRSRHRTLSFRFDSPVEWRARIPTRDGKTYPINILRAVYETAP